MSMLGVVKLTSAAAGHASQECGPREAHLPVVQGNAEIWVLKCDPNLGLVHMRPYP